MLNFKNLKNFFPKFINKKNYLKNKKLLEIEQAHFEKYFNLLYNLKY